MNRTLLTTLFLLACSTGAPEVNPPGEPEAASSAGAADAPKKADGDHAHHAAGIGGVPGLPAVPEGARVFFTTPADGSKVSSPVTIEMGIAGMTVKPAKEVEPGTGHHHLLVDTDGIPASQVVPKDAQHIHFGDGSTSTKLELEPGEHRLMLQFADGIHRSYGPAMSTAITVTVE